MIRLADILAASILVVDDQEANVSLLAQMRRGAGYTSIASTTHPREVCELHRKNHYSLILLDLQMPGMEGFQVMEGLKAIETYGYLPVLVITAQPDLKLRALKGGAKDFVSKPFELQEVLIRVYNILKVRLEDLAAGIEAGKGTVGKLITDTALADEAQQFLARANQAMSELGGVVTNLDVAVKNVRNGTARLPEITDAVADEAKDLPGLVLQTQTSMRELERLIEAVQRHWLVRKYVNPTNPPPRRPLSASEAPQTKPVKALRSPKDFVN